MCIMLRYKNIEDKTTDITNLATNTTLNAKINEVKNKISNITNLATTTTTAITGVKNKISGHSKYITTQEVNKSTAEHMAARLA